MEDQLARARRTEKASLTIVLIYLRGLSMKYALLFLSLLILVNCRQVSNPTPSTDPAPQVETPAPAENTPSPETTPVPSVPASDSVDCAQEPSKPVGPEYPIKDAKKIFTAKVIAKGFDSKQAPKIDQAEKFIVKVVNSDEFEQRVKNFIYEGKKQFVDNDGLSNDQIYTKIFEGAEALMPAVNYQMDLTAVSYYSRWVSTVGYTYPDVLEIYMNYKFYSQYDACEVSGNMFHEWLHKLGFKHALNYSVSRDSSIPYALGHLMEELCKKYM